jgi:hypothetical protein
MGAVSSRDFVLEAMQWASTVMIHISRQAPTNPQLPRHTLVSPSKLTVQQMGRGPYHLLHRRVQLCKTGGCLFHGKFSDATEEEP